MQTHHSILKTAEDKRRFVLRVLQIQDESYLPISESDFEAMYSQTGIAVYEYKQDDESPREFIDSALSHLRKTEDYCRNTVLIVSISTPKDIELMLDDMRAISSLMSDDGYSDIRNNDEDNDIVKLGIGKSMSTDKVQLFVVFTGQCT